MIEALLGNLAVAGGLGLAAAIVARIGRHPTWVHTLCVLALLKLITPPVWRAPVLPAVVPEQKLALQTERGLQELLAAPTALGVPTALHTVRPSVPSPAHAAPDESATEWSAVLGVWLSGTIVVLVLAGRRARSFRLLLRQAVPASPRVIAEATRIAERLGIRRLPEILVVDARLPPLLSPTGFRLVLVLPSRLLAELTDDARRVLLAHELAHVHRRDHLVRLLELVVTALLWWLPLVWWLRRTLREAEEQCCDQWVVWTLPERARCYADALVDTAAFLSGPAAAMPPLASGAIRTRLLQERLKMILSPTTPRRPTRGLIPLALLAAVALPILPGRAQEPNDGQRARLDAALQRIEKLEARLRELIERTSRSSADAPPRDPAQRYRTQRDPADTPATADTVDPRSDPTAAIEDVTPADPSAADRLTLLRLLIDRQAPAPQGREYMVQPGDTIGSIARRYHGSPDQAEWLVELNRIEDPRKLPVGTRLRLGIADPHATDPSTDEHVPTVAECLRAVKLMHQLGFHSADANPPTATTPPTERLLTETLPTETLPPAAGDQDQELQALRAQVQSLQDQLEALRNELRNSRRDDPFEPAPVEQPTRLR